MLSTAPLTDASAAVCGVPPEYCEYGSTYEKCKEWQLKNCPELVPQLKEQAEKAEAERKAKAEAAAAAKAEASKDGAKAGEEGDGKPAPAAAAKPKKKKKVSVIVVAQRYLISFAGEASVYGVHHASQPRKAQVHHCGHWT